MSRRILVAEDEHAIRLLVTQILQLNGYDVTSVADGAAAMEAVRSATPDLVVLDVMMPGADGISILRAMRGDPRTRTIPVVMLTAKTDDATTWAGWSNGCDYYLTKPFEPDELLTVASRLLAAR